MFLEIEIDFQSTLPLNVVPGKSKLRIDLLRTKPEDIKDPEKKAKYLPNSFKYWNQHVSTVSIYKESDIDYILYLTKQVYNKFFQD